MNIYEYLKADHKKVAELFRQFKKAKLKSQKKKILGLITETIILHTRAEQEVFYKLLEQLQETRNEVRHGRDEHKEIEEQIYIISQDKKFNTNWEQQVLKLHYIFKHHSDEEEKDIFLKAQKLLTQEESCILKEQVDNYKKRLSSQLFH